MPCPNLPSQICTLTGREQERASVKPEYGYAALDVFMCGEAKPHLAVDVIREAFQPEEITVHEYLRGKNLPVAA